VEGVLKYNIANRHNLELKIAKILNDDSPWGIYKPLGGTIFENYVPIIDAEILSDAHYGHTKALLEALGRPPSACLKLFSSSGNFVCAASKRCVGFDNKKCRPVKDVPPCYELPVSDSLGLSAIRRASDIIQAWREDYYVIRISGKEIIMR